MDFLNSIILLTNFIIVPGITYGSQLALGAIGVTLIYGVLRFANFAYGDLMAFGTMIVILVTWFTSNCFTGMTSWYPIDNCSEFIF